MQEATSRLASRQSAPANQATRVKPLPPPKNFGAKQIEICRSWNKFISNSPRSAEQKGASCRNTDEWRGAQLLGGSFAQPNDGFPRAIRIAPLWVFIEIQLI